MKLNSQEVAGRFSSERIYSKHGKNGGSGNKGDEDNDILKPRQILLPNTRRQDTRGLPLFSAFTLGGHILALRETTGLDWGQEAAIPHLDVPGLLAREPE